MKTSISCIDLYKISSNICILRENFEEKNQTSKHIKQISVMIRELSIMNKKFV